MDDGASFSAIILFLPFVYLMNQFEEGAFGNGCVSIHGPAQELELLHHSVPILRLEGEKHVRSHFKFST